MGRYFGKSGRSRREWFDGAHKFEHWYRDRSVYLITARVRDRKHVFVSGKTCSIFWEKLDQYSTQHGFQLWIATLMSNHYHVIGFLQEGRELGQMMRKLHGSIAWMVCKELRIAHKPFWRDDAHRDYFDGCLRDEVQLRRSYRYVETQAVRAGLVADPHLYAGTRPFVSVEEACRLARKRHAYLPHVPYARYIDPTRKRGKQIDR